MTDLHALLARARLTAGHGAPVLLPPAEALALVEEVERLRAEVAAERAAVVAWLNAEANEPHPIEAGERALSPSGRGLLLRAADTIERGEHRREEKP
jgi:hypothetical protein